ncbi:hypothetical protein B484DRAFT_409582 [Ochromonadaceae sp. CCMP2298]|nr:hypothetical protein B484DRAFT_409582 [Ochromonadaceae sp. CCMP2298]
MSSPVRFSKRVAEQVLRPDNLVSSRADVDSFEYREHRWTAPPTIVDGYNLALPYGGVGITNEQIAKLAKNGPRVWRGEADYILDGTKKFKGGWNAHPSQESAQAPTNAWLGSLLNEPTLDTNQEANSNFVTLAARGMPIYPEHDRSHGVGVVVTSSVLSGQQLFVEYNRTTNRRVHSRQGYWPKPSQSVQKRMRRRVPEEPPTEQEVASKTTVFKAAQSQRGHTTNEKRRAKKAANADKSSVMVAAKAAKRARQL